MSDGLLAALSGLLPPRSARGPARVAIVTRREVAAGLGLAALGHRVLVCSDRFRTLVACRDRRDLVTALRCQPCEASFPALPLARAALDALILADGWPRRGDPDETLAVLRAAVAVGGLVAVAHPVTDGWSGILAQALAPAARRRLAPEPRHALTRRFMAHGLVDVGQRALAGSPLPWWLTFGTVPGGPAR